MTIIGILLIVLFGYQLANLLIRKSDFFEKLALGYLLGLGLFTLFWFLLNLGEIPYNMLSSTLLVFVLNGIMLVVSKLTTCRYFEKPKFDFDYFKNLNKLEITVLVIVLFLSLSVVIADLYMPVNHWDALALYDFRARLFAQDGYMGNAIAQGYFFGYPLLTSLAHTLVYVTGFNNPSFLYGLFYISLVILFFINIKKFRLSRTWVFVLTLMAVTTPRIIDHTQWAYTNLPYSVYIVLGSVYLYWGIKNKNIGPFILSAILIGLSTWTRSTEPFWLTYIGITILSAVIVKKWLWPVLYVGIVAALMMPWRIFQAAMQNVSSNVAEQVIATSGFAIQNLQYQVVKPAFEFFIANVIKMYPSYFVLLAIIIVFKISSKSKKWLFIGIIICNLLLVFFGIIVFSKTQASWQQIPDSLSRMVMFIPPLVIFLLGEELAAIFKYKK